MPSRTTAPNPDDLAADDLEKGPPIEAAPKKRVVQVLTRKDAGAWQKVFEKVSADHWRKIKVTIKFREKLLGGVGASLDAVAAQLKAHKVEDKFDINEIEDPAVRAELIEQIEDQGLCQFHRRNEKPGIWFPTNNIKAGFKENWSVLGYTKEYFGTRGVVREALFVRSMTPAPSIEWDWVPLGEYPDNTLTSVSHTSGPKGPVSALKRNEYVEKRTISFLLCIERRLAATRLFDEAIGRTLLHFGDHGLGASRSQGYGKFDVLSTEDV